MVALTIQTGLPEKCNADACCATATELQGINRGVNPYSLTILVVFISMSLLPMFAAVGT